MQRFPISIDRRHRRRAFTIVELLLVMAITMILFVVLAQVTWLSSSTWQRVQGGSERQQNARAILDAMRVDLANALLSPSPANLFDPDGHDSLEFVLNPDLPAEWKNPSALFWQAPIAPDARSGEIAEVGYFVAWDESDSANPRSHLRRFFVGPDNEDAFRIYKSPNNWLTPDIIRSVANADKSSNYSGLFAEDVLGFWARCMKWDKTSGTMLPIDGPGGRFNSREGFDPVLDPASGKTVSKRLPFAVEIGLVLVDVKHAMRIGSAEKSAITLLVSQSASATEFVEKARENPALKKIAPGIRAYVTTIPLKNYSELGF